MGIDNPRAETAAGRTTAANFFSAKLSGEMGRAGKNVWEEHAPTESE